MKKAILLLIIVLASCTQAEKRDRTQSTPAEETGVAYVVLQSNSEGIEIEITKVKMDDQIVEDTTLEYKPYLPAVLSSISKRQGTIKQTTIETGRVKIDGKEATMPSKTIIIDTPIPIINNQATALVLEIQKEESTYEGKETIFAPVFRQYIVRNAKVKVEPTRYISIEGTKEPQAKIGMNEKGQTGPGMHLPKTSEITVEEGKISITQATITEPKIEETKEEPPSRTIKMTAINHKISPMQITTSEGETITMAITSIDNEYGIRISGYNITGKIPARKETKITFTTDTKGIYEYYCNPCAGKQEKLWGKLMVN